MCILTSSLFSFLRNLEYNFFGIDILHVCGMHHFLYSEFLKLNIHDFLKEGITGVHVH
jgi:hypothetical protein